MKLVEVSIKGIFPEEDIKEFAKFKGYNESIKQEINHSGMFETIRNEITYLDFIINYFQELLLNEIKTRAVSLAIERNQNRTEQELKYIDDRLKESLRVETKNFEVGE